MGKHKQIHTVHRCDEWLSTRTKRKVVTNPPAIKRASLSRPLRNIGNILLIQSSPPPEELKTHTKQSKLSNFFHRKLSGIDYSEDEQIDSSEELPILTCLTKLQQGGNKNRLPPFNGQHSIDGTGDHVTIDYSEEELPSLSRKCSPGCHQNRKLITNINQTQPVMNFESYSGHCDKENKQTKLPTVNSAGTVDLSEVVTSLHDRKYAAETECDWNLVSEVEDIKTIDKGEPEITQSLIANLKTVPFEKNQMKTTPYLKSQVLGCDKERTYGCLKVLDSSDVDLHLMSEVEIPGRNCTTKPHNCMLNGSDLSSLPDFQIEGKLPLAKTHERFNSEQLEMDLTEIQALEEQLDNKPYPNSDKYSLDSTCDEIQTTKICFKFKQSVPGTLDSYSDCLSFSSSAGEDKSSLMCTHSVDLSSDFSCNFNLNYRKKQKDLISTQEANNELEDFSLDSQMDL